MQYNFDWDPAKERANLQQHNEEHSEEEDRWITIGIDSGGVLRVVSHTFIQVTIEHCEIRIISARKAEPPEIIQYQSENT